LFIFNYQQTNQTMTKIKKETQVFRKTCRTKPFTWADLKKIAFEDGDVLSIGYDEGFYSENNSCSPYYYAEVIRMVEETDEEHQTRLAEIARQKEQLKARRFETYQKLKAEFEGQ
jgi:hypothetical protein